jgi:ribosomal-protein-alanine N-acetyltransferase
MDAPYTIRPATEAELDEVVAMEQAVFTDPWSRASFRHSLDDVFLVALDGRGVIGYVVARLAADTGEILNLAVRSDARRRKVAWTLVDTAIGILETRGSQTVFLEVRASNEGARRLYENMSFTEVGRRVGYYGNPVEDALVLARPTMLESQHSAG